MKGLGSNRTKREGHFVGTKFFGFKFPRKLALQNYSRLPLQTSRCRAYVCVCAAIEQPVRATRLKNISYLLTSDLRVFHTAAYVQIARCTNRSIIRLVIDQFFPNRGAHTARTSENIYIYIYSLGEISLEIPAIEGTTTYNAICFN